MNYPRLQAKFKRSRHNQLSIFSLVMITTNPIKKRSYLMEISITIFEPNNFLDIRNIYQDKDSMGMILKEFKYLTSTCWNENYQPLTIDMTKDKYTGRY